jgi:hypothetical protein
LEGYDTSELVEKTMTGIAVPADQLLTKTVSGMIPT